MGPLTSVTPGPLSAHIWPRYWHHDSGTMPIMPGDSNYNILPVVSIFDGVRGRNARLKQKMSALAEACPQVRRLPTFPVLRAFAGFCFRLLGGCGCFALETACVQCVKRSFEKSILVAVGCLRCLPAFCGQACRQQKLHETYY